MISFENLTVSFDGRIILDDISGSLKSEKINIIIGPSGTGKSVFFKSLLGLIELDAGRIFFDDDEMKYSDKDVDTFSFRNKIGVLQQKPALLQDKTVEENIRLYLDILTDLNKFEKKDLVDFYLEQVGMKGFNNKYPGELSGGMQKKIGIACAIAHRPKYLFCDEPNSGLDPESSKKIDALVKRISKEHKMTIVIISHNLDSVIGMGENIVFLSSGKIRWEGNRKEIFDVDVPELNKFLKSSSMFEKYKKIVLDEV